MSASNKKQHTGLKSLSGCEIYIDIDRYWSIVNNMASKEHKPSDLKVVSGTNNCGTSKAHVKVLNS